MIAVRHKVRRLWWLGVLAAVVLILRGGTAVYAQSAWLAVYWNNINLDGAPVLIRPEFDDNDNPDIHINWGLDGPGDPVHKEFFSARWTRTQYLEPGRYRFTATADDGVRVWVAGQLLIDAWLNQPQTTYVAYIDLDEGVYPLRVEYYQNQHQALINLTWERVPGSEVALAGPGWNPPPGGWRGEYYNNLLFAGPPNLVRTDPQIDFDWALESPAPQAIVRDRFAVRWTNTLNLEPGRYRFTTTSDDGVRLWLDGVLRIDQWHSQTSLAHSTEVDVAGPVAVKLEYYDEIGLAEARLTWERLAGPATAQPASQPAASGSMPGQESTPVATVTNANVLNVRSGPGMTYDPFTYLTRGQSVTLLARSATTAWLQVQLVDGRTGWVANGFMLTTYPLVSLPVAIDN